ncbi:MAG: hypothetical protein EBU08_06995 [Micrococcales bacterium]|nr:hypothetical protein [Micrococcales bacterium]
MSPFNFQAIQTLDITKEDNPHIDVRDGQLVLTAERGNDRIMIIAPLNSVLPKVDSTTVRRPARRRRRSPIKNQTLPSTDPRVGEGNALSKLTETEVCEIRALAEDPDYRKEFKSPSAMYMAIGQVYKVHFTTIYNVVHRQSWKHVN